MGEDVEIIMRLHRYMKEITKKEGIKVAILSVPAESAQKVAHDLARCGIKAILNFAPVNLVLPKDVFVSNVDMASELEGLIYKLKRNACMRRTL